MSNGIRIAALPMALRWHVEPVSWAITGEAGLTIESGPATDLFIDPSGKALNLSAPRLLGEVEGDFTFRAQVQVAFTDTFDAGALLAWVDDRNWGKLCFEAAPSGQPMVVSVVTHGRSDDANAFDVGTGRIWLRIARMGDAFAFHASRDGVAWQLVRHFRMPAGPTVHLGLLGQSPTGPGSHATFSDIRLTDRRLDEIRDGT